MRSIILAIVFALAALPGWHVALAEPGMEAQRISRASSVESGLGAVIISIRSEIYLDDPLNVFFLREGGNITNDADVVRFERKQGFFAFGNDTVKFQVRAFELQPGTYRLVAHGMNCPKVPAEDERCLIAVQGVGGGAELSRPSRGYGEEAPTFEVLPGSVTYAGDFTLMSRNTIEWGEIPENELSRMRSRFNRMPSAPAPVVPESFVRKFGVFPRQYEDDRNRRY